MGVRVLVLEKDPAMASLLRDALVSEGHAVELATIHDAVARARDVRPEVVLLDWPDRLRDGRELCVELRKKSVHALMVTCVSASSAVLRSIFESGADDVVRKPFDLDELLLRVEALARRVRTSVHADGELRVGAIRVEHGQARVHGAVVALTQRELAMLTHLARRADRTVTVAELSVLVWGRAAPTSNSVVAHVSHLRSKLGRAASQLRTVRGVGYILSSSTEVEDGGRDARSID
jgi:DNA-binding response OmpR family regulator